MIQFRVFEKLRESAGPAKRYVEELSREWARRA
jgi:hypothetical protein